MNLVHDQSIIITQNVPAEDNKDTVNQMTDLVELDEDEMLMRAIAMSLEEEEEMEEERKVDEEKLGFTRHHGPGEFIKTQLQCSY